MERFTDILSFNVMWLIGCEFEVARNYARR